MEDKLKSFRFGSVEREIVRGVMERYGLTFSAALRLIVRDWNTQDRIKDITDGSPQPITEVQHEPHQ
jgi:hypothetical protein